MKVNSLIPSIIYISMLYFNIFVLYFILHVFSLICRTEKS